MADLTNLDNVDGSDLTEAQIKGILAQIDLDIHNLMRGGKLATLVYGQGRAQAGTGRWANRAEALRGLREARELYTRMLNSLPAFEISQQENCS